MAPASEAFISDRKSEIFVRIKPSQRNNAKVEQSSILCHSLAAHLIVPRVSGVFARMIPPMPMAMEDPRALGFLRNSVDS